MSSVNKAILVGRVGRDPEGRNTQGGMTVSNFSIATDRTRKGEKITTWHRCVAFDKTADVINQYVTKGQMLYVEGSIDHEEYTDKDGVKKTVTKIIVNNVQMLSSRQDGGQPAQREERPAAKPARRSSAPEFDDSDDIPFANPYRGSFLYVI